VRILLDEAVLPNRYFKDQSLGLDGAVGYDREGDADGWWCGGPIPENSDEDVEDPMFAIELRDATPGTIEAAFVERMRAQQAPFVDYQEVPTITGNMVAVSRFRPRDY
jgi:hypothetical protein